MEPLYVLFIFFKKASFNFMCMYLSVYIHLVHVGVLRAGEGVRSLGAGVTGGCEPPVWVLGSKQKSL